VALVSVDAPKASKLPRLAAATTDLAVVRFHGRSEETWSTRTTSAAERFRYLYDERELRPWADRVRHLARAATHVDVLMNNCYQDYGVRNASDLVDLLGGGD
jgi:uncharacterized protein YecE (DUF72 family)